MISQDLAKKYLLDEDINKYLIYYLLIFTPIVYYYLVINSEVSIFLSTLNVHITYYIVLITILTLLTEVFNIQYKLFTRFITTTMIFITWPLMVILSSRLSVIFMSTIFVSNVIVFSITIYKINFTSGIKNIYGKIKKDIYKISKTYTYKISKYKILILIIIVFLTPLLLPSFGEPSSFRSPDAQANVSYDLFSYNNTTEYDVAISINNMENSDYLIIKEQKASSKTSVSRCTNNEPNDVDYAPDISNESGIITQKTHSKYASIILSKCETALVKGLDIGDKVQVYGGRSGIQNLIDIYEVN